MNAMLFNNKALHSLLHSPSGKPPVDWGGTNLNMIVVAVIFSITTWHCIWVYIFTIASHFVSNLSDGTRDGGYSQLQGCFHQTMFIFRTANIICIISNGEKISTLQELDTLTGSGATETLRHILFKVFWTTLQTAPHSDKYLLHQ